MTFDASQLDARLAPVADAYREVKVREQGELPPDGDYQARVESFDFIESKAGELFLKTIMSIVAGAGDEWQGCEATTLHAMDNEDRLVFLKRHLRSLDVEDPDELLGLRARLARVVGAIVNIRVKTSTSTDSDGKPWRNVYVNGRVESDVPIDTGGLGGVPMSASVYPASDGDDSPFAFEPSALEFDVWHGHANR